MVKPNSPKQAPQAQAKAEAAQPAATRPIIEYLGEGAEKVEFTINPLAVRYVVRADGLIIEYLE